ncbi:MAG: endonuclease V [Candidatus Aenigmarchaeota archaeon]|nr:endonuclease V [Candidatus Aenigmarchaeota archaeon]NIP40402.1 endonuclease V [Candidatus Aenigmarchaeota archaeon]NIQ18328.1 endonuclease V [Candidatus Aenigmarchaeota archaeon]NIS73280.1 endonuclease V [Candidatus Aenigmarchaeota archaeon]
MRHDIEGMREEQRRIAKRVVIEDRLPKRIKTIGGFDTGYSGGRAKVAGVVLDYKTLEILERKTFETSVRFPYVPTFLTFREGPLLVRVYRKLKTKPDILMFNGQGIAHPLRAGLASHVGVLLGKPSVGVAQKRLIGEYREPRGRDDFKRLIFEGKQVGWVLRSKEGCKPIFVSPGHRVSVQRSLSVCVYCLGGRKLPEPLALAHEFSK